MEFDWRGAIDRNCEILCDIAFRLIVMAGIEAGRTAETLPRHLYLRILSILRSAEFATRRLIAMAACKLDFRFRMAAPKAAEPSSPFRGEVDLPREAKLSGSANRVRGKEAPTPPHQLRLARCAHKPSYPLPRGATTNPRIPAFALFDPFKPFPEPWLTPEQIAALDNPAVPLFVPASPSNEPVDARPLCRRIRALQAALLDLDGEALRLARWRARRAAGIGRPVRLTPFRPGYPPGWKKHPKTDVEEVLRECNCLGLEAWDTTLGRGPPASGSEA